MKLPYVISLYIAAIFIFSCSVFSKVKTKHDPIEKPARKLLYFAAAALASHATAICLSSQLAAAFVFGFYNCFIDAMVISLLHFVRCYTGTASKNKWEPTCLLAAMLLDCFFMLINPFTELNYRIQLFVDGRGHPYYYIAERGFLNTYHLAFVYLTMLLLLVILIRKMISIPKIYKIKYAMMLSSLCIVLVLHAAYLNFSFAFDYSLFFYVVIAFSVFYFSMVFVPKGLIENLLFFSVSNMEDGIVCVDIDGKCVHVNKAATLYFQDENGVNNMEERIQKWFAEHPDTQTQDMSWESVSVIDGETRYYHHEYHRIIDQNDRYLGCFFILHDRTEEYYRLAEEKYRATHDALTGIFNKDYFYEASSAMLEANPDKQYCMVCMDIKNFKLVNDMFGVEAGDTILKRIAASISKLATKYTVFGRLTGDRFAMLMLEERVNENLFLTEAEKLNHILNNSVFKLHAHFGVYHIEDPALKISIMCDRAFLAIKSIKDSYQSVVAYYDQNLRDYFINEQKIISEFEQAILQGQFHAYIQPQISVDGKILGGEALVRWIHPHEGMVAPYKFISIFERTGLISRLDPYIWETACTQLQKWEAEGHKDHYISVNISPKDFLLIDVYETLVSLVTKYNIAPHKLHLEITETSVMDNPKEQLPLINKLRSFGFIVEIDDFGSGYSSLNTLKDLNVDVLKIDMGFLSKTNNIDRSMTILKMIIALAKSLNMEVITEGVETKEQVDLLTEFGCDMFQGYYFAKPMQVSDFEMKYLN